MSKINPVIQELVNKTFLELKRPTKSVQKSRISNSSNGYIHLVAWSNASLFRILVRKFTGSLPKSEHRLKAQFDDNARSVIANIEEGFARPTTSEYLTFLGYSQASLIEGKGDAQRSLQDGFLISKPGSKIHDLGINLFDWHEALKQSVISKPVDFIKEKRKRGNFRGNYGNLEDIRNKSNSNNYPLNPFKFLYFPVDDLNLKNLTYEIFIELINKTDWHLRRLVESLEKKLEKDQKYYQVEKLRLRSKIY